MPAASNPNVPYCGFRAVDGSAIGDAPSTATGAAAGGGTSLEAHPTSAVVAARNANARIISFPSIAVILQPRLRARNQDRPMTIDDRRRTGCEPCLSRGL
jgi:hypothetical protein